MDQHGRYSIIDIKTQGTAHAEALPLQWLGVGAPPRAPPKDVHYAQKLIDKKNLHAQPLMGPGTAPTEKSSACAVPRVF